MDCLPDGRDSPGRGGQNGAPYNRAAGEARALQFVRLVARVSESS